MRKNRESEPSFRFAVSHYSGHNEPLVSYVVKGGELLIDRKEKSIIRATVELAYRRAVEMGGIVEEPKKLG